MKLNYRVREQVEQEGTVQKNFQNIQRKSPLEATDLYVISIIHGVQLLAAIGAHKVLVYDFLLQQGEHSKLFEMPW